MGKGKNASEKMLSKVDQGWDVEFSDDSDKRTFTQLLVLNTIKVSIILGALYVFICDLSFLASAFRLLAGKQAGEVFGDSEVRFAPLKFCQGCCASSCAWCPLALGRNAARVEHYILVH